jgi:hypothetical protein
VDVEKKLEVHSNGKHRERPYSPLVTSK